MEKNKSLFIGMIILLAGWFCVGVSLGQTVEVVNDGFAINLKSLSGMGCTTAVKGRFAEMSPSVYANFGVENYVNGNLTVKMYQYFQVTNSLSSSHYTWVDSFQNCKKLGEGWRLPTVRELIMIWVLHPQLVKLGSGTVFPGEYWSITEGSGGSSGCVALSVNFSDGTVRALTKTGSCYYRCIREL